MVKPDLHLTEILKTSSASMLSFPLTFSCQDEALFLQFARR